MQVVTCKKRKEERLDAVAALLNVGRDMQYRRPRRALVAHHQTTIHASASETASRATDNGASRRSRRTPLASSVAAPEHHFAQYAILL